MKKLLTLLTVVTAMFKASIAQTCDTLLNVSLTTDTAQYLLWGQPNEGFVSGNGAVSDNQLIVRQTGVAEKFTTPSGAYVTAAFIYPAYTTILGSDSTDSITVYVYNDNGTPLEGPANAPGTALDSAKLSLQQLAATVTEGIAHFAAIPLLVNFTHQVTLPGTSFYIGVTFTQITGDTVVIFSNTGNTAYGHGWLQIAQQGTPGWLAYDSIIPGINQLGLYIGAIVCGGITGITEVSNSPLARVYPNPATDVLNLEFPQSTNAEVSVIDLTGKVISTTAINGATQTLYNIHNLAAGTYILHITDKASNQQQRILFDKL